MTKEQKVVFLSALFATLVSTLLFGYNYYRLIHETGWRFAITYVVLSTTSGIVMAIAKMLMNIAEGKE